MRTIFLFCSFLSFYLNISAQTPAITTGLCKVSVYFDEKEVRQKARGLDQDSLLKAEKALFEQMQGQTTGTGFLYQHEGKYFVVTCAHVVNKSWITSVKAEFENQTYTLRPWGTDTFLDIAFLELENYQPSKDKRYTFSFANVPISGQEVSSWKNNGNSFSNYTALVENVVESENSYRFFQIGAKNTEIQFRMSGSPVLQNQSVVGMLCLKNGQNANQGMIIEAKMLDRVFQNMQKYRDTYGYSNERRYVRAFMGARFEQNAAKEIYIASTLPSTVNDSRLRAFIGKRISTINQKKIVNLGDIIEIMENVSPEQKIEIKFQDGTQIMASTSTLREDNLTQIAKDYFKGNEQLGKFSFDCSSPKLTKPNGQSENIQFIGGSQGTHFENVKFIIADCTDLGVSIRLFSQDNSFKINGKPIFNNLKSDLKVLYY